MILATVLAIFDPPTPSELHAERVSCYASRICRALIDDRPPAVLEAMSDVQPCANNAARAIDALGKAGFRGHVLTVKTMRGLHAYAVVTIDGKDWAIGQGAFCHGACRLEEATHGL